MEDTSTSQKTTPEAGFNYIKQAGQSQANTAQNALQVHELMDQQQAAYSDAIFSQKAAGAATQAKLSAQDAIDSSVDAQVAAMQETLGTDWTSNASASSKWARELQDNTQKAYAALDVVHESQSKTLMNDPLGYLMTQFTLPADTATYNYYAQKAQIAEGALNEVLSASNSAAIAANNMKKLTSTELALAKSQEAAAASALQAGKLTLEAAGTRIAGINNLQSLSQQQLQNVVTVHSMQNDDRRLAMADEQQKYMREAKADALDLKRQDDESIRKDLEAYNMGAKRVGLASISDVATFKRVKATINSNPRFAATLVAGQMMQANGGSIDGVPVAQTSGEAALLYSSGQANLTGNPVGQFLRDQLTAVRTGPGAPKDEASLAAKTTENIQALATKARATIRDDDVNNIYDAPPLPAMLQATPKVFPKDIFFAKELAPILEKNPNYSPKNTEILAKAAEMAKGGTADFNAAIAGVVNYYNSAIAVNATTKQYLEHGLPEQKTGFNASIWGRTVDLTDPVQVRALIMRRLGFAQPLFNFGQLSEPGMPSQ